MKNPYRNHPPLNSLVGFEAAARLGSFSLAAIELNVTQSAISHQIRSLEEHLRQPLFFRVNRRVELTDAGRDLRDTAESALETVRRGIKRLDAYSKPGSVVLHMPYDLAALWFVPRLKCLREDHPLVEPWLFTSSSEVDLSESEIDITVTTNPQDANAEVSAGFIEESRAPYASPAVAEAFRAFPESTALLHDEKPGDWQEWFAVAGLERQEYTSGFNFSDTAMALNAAAGGLGVCLANPVLAKTMLDRGILELAHDVVLGSKKCLCLAALKHNLGRESVRQLWDWLIAQSGEVD